MSQSRLRSSAGIAAAVFALGLGCARGPADGGAPRDEAILETRVSMAQIVAPLRVALPLSLSEERFAAPENHDALSAALAQLSSGASQLEVHGRSRDESFAYLSRSLAHDATEIERRFDAGELEQSRFLLGELVENCVGCHSRLESPEGSNLGRVLFDAVDAEGLTPEERVLFQVATRQFDPALDGYEALLLSPERSAPELDFEGVLSDYLLVSIRVKGDLERPRATLTRFRERDDVPRYLNRSLGIWIESLSELTLDVPKGHELTRAREVTAAGQALRRFPTDRTGLVHDLVASALLHRGLWSGEISGEQAAEAYYLLGLAELRNPHSFWLAQAEHYLETAIRMAPGSEAAEDAYAVLEEETLAGYSGSGGVRLPADVQSWLDELHDLAVPEPAAAE